MDQQSKANVVKSRSSNTAMTKSDRGSDKKSRSSGEFKTLVVKKRGVYVEKRRSTSATNKLSSPPDTSETKPKVKAPRRPGTKTFLASVLTILSKSTASTQYPPTKSEAATRKNRPLATIVSNRSTKHSLKISRKASPKMQTKDELKQKASVKDSNQNKPTKKLKYKSKVLNDEVNKKSPERLVVLKSKNDIINTPTASSFSKITKDTTSNHSIKWAEFLPKQTNSITGDPKSLKEKNINMDHAVAKSVMEGNKLNMEKQMVEPSTLVNAPAKDEKLYSLFVNLLETVYSVKPDYDAVSVKSVKSSKVQFEMDDNVAQKLNATKQHQEKYEDEDAPPCCERTYTIKPQDNLNKETFKHLYTDTVRHETFPAKWSEPGPQPKRTIKRVKNNLESESFSYGKKPVAAKGKKASLNKKNKKSNLLNVLKEELSMDCDVFDEEPENFYDALRVIARNKRNCQKSIHFDSSAEKARNYGSDYNSVCMFKRRKVISPSTRLPKYIKTYKPESDYFQNSSSVNKSPEMSRFTASRAGSTILPSDTDESLHSLAVYGYDYEKRSLAAFEQDSVNSDETETGTDNEQLNWQRGFMKVNQLWK